MGTNPNKKFDRFPYRSHARFASGHNNNKCIVIPSWNMVIVRMGEDGHPENQDVVYGTVLQMLGDAIYD